MKESKMICLKGWQVYDTHACVIIFNPTDGSELLSWTKSPSDEKLRQASLVTRMHIKNFSHTQEKQELDGGGVETIARVKSYYLFGSPWPHVQEWKLVHDDEGNTMTIVRKEGTWYQLEGQERAKIFLPDVCRERKKVERLDIRVYSDFLCQKILTSIPVYG